MFGQGLKSYSFFQNNLTETCVYINICMQQCAQVGRSESPFRAHKSFSYRFWDKNVARLTGPLEIDVGIHNPVWSHKSALTFTVSQRVAGQMLNSSRAEWGKNGADGKEDCAAGRQEKFDKKAPPPFHPSLVSTHTLKALSVCLRSKERRKRG